MTIFSAEQTNSKMFGNSMIKKPVDANSSE